MASAAKTELIRSLEEGGLSRKAAEELVAALGHSHRRERRSDSWMLAYAALLTALIVGGFGWMNSRIDNLDAKTTTQISTLDAKIGSLDAKIDETREEMVQRLTTIETIIKERLPSAPR
ncbi:MAG: hypothetical protein OXF88_00225 [Rhodobacteraceae bacterium]|nr:hypothetical protein [Paracoccaceae bacterium]